MAGWYALADLLLPPACAVCRSPHDARVVTPGGRHREDRPDEIVREIVCGVCLGRVVPLPQPQCRRCGHPRLSLAAPLPAGTAPTGAPDSLPPCRWCARLPSHVRAVRSACRMDEGTGSALVHALKYNGWSAVAAPMARLMARADFPDDVVAERVAVVPVPLAAARLRERGFNQAERLARAVAAHWALPVWHDVVHRARATRSQVRLTPSERAGNVSHAFVAASSARSRLSGAHLVLVDDVITTAATLNAVAGALVDGGARICSYLTFGRAPEPGDRTDPDLAFDQD